MNILILAGIFPPDIGGPANYIPRLCEGLLAKRHHVQVLCFSDAPTSSLDEKLPYTVIRINRHQGFVQRELKTILNGISLAQKADVIYANGNDFKAMLIGWFTNKPRVHKIVGDTAWERAQNRRWTQITIDDYQKSSKKFFLLFLDWVRSFPLRQASKVITPSNYLGRLVEGWHVDKNKIKVIYNSFQPLPETSFQPPVFFSSNLKVMATICRLVPWKGVDTLITSLKDFKNLGLLIIGDGPLDHSLRKMAFDLKLEEQIFFTGRQERKNIKSFLDKADFFILNSSYEGLPHVVLEAMSCKKLVLASAVGGTPELVKNGITGLAFSYNDKASIQKAILSALNDDNQKLVENASQFIQKEFSFETMLSETEKVLQSAVTESRL